MLYINSIHLYKCKSVKCTLGRARAVAHEHLKSWVQRFERCAIPAADRRCWNKGRTLMSQIIKTIIAQQRMLLQSWLAGPMQRLTAACVRCWPARTALERYLAQGLDTLPWCKHLFVLDNRAHQRTANVSPGGLLPAYFERDRSGRPDLSHALPRLRLRLLRDHHNPPCRYRRRRPLSVR